MKRRRNPTSLFALLLSCVIRSDLALGFGTINEPEVVGQHCEHERITRAAFACPPGVTTSDGRCFEELSLHQLAGRSGPEGHVGWGTNGAVGAPDMLDPTPEGPEAHCDNADFLDTEAHGLKGEYPRTREEATAQLQVCTNHMRLRFLEGVDAADRIVDHHARIVVPEVDISGSDCRFSFPELQMHWFSRGKCSAIEGFGRALHGIQDFYAHSNWADEAKPPYGLSNPPGLKMNKIPVFLDLRAENNITDQVPHDLSTGCFGGIMTDGPEGKAGHPLEPGSLDCTGRVTHHTLNKDNGIIDYITGKTTKPGPNTPRSDIPGNFERAVSAAIKDSRRQWRYFREQIRRTYGKERGNIIICALIRDNPTHDCYGRRVAMLQDALRNTSRIAEMQIPIQAWLLQEIEGTAHDEGPGEGLTAENSTKSLGSSGELGDEETDDKGHFVKKLQHPPHEGLDVGVALKALRHNATIFPTNKTAIIALTKTRNKNLDEQIAHVWHAGDEGIRVHFGLLPPPRSPSDESDATHEDAALTKAKEQDLITGVLRTGGTYSILHNEDAVPSFLDHVVSRGLTQYDNARDTATLLAAGLSISDYVTPESEPRRFSFDASELDNAIISVHPITPKLSLHVCMRHVRRNVVLKELDIGLDGNATFRAELGIGDVPRTDAWFELEVAHVEGGGLVGSGLFEVSIATEDVERYHSSKAVGEAVETGVAPKHNEL
ncbi:uncharacterized protein CC84DRAFT_1201070 [Paraphaeosphaeria sporulosa]|uniref:Uncharacterized protein n=1 Tax=Paraphaeosphaeria sporulosa TaxID=1460663 RepID=A0A177CXJ7_9PLEO|nr:uncharacterized protein CC84DRAFT_1201070 [Paraphaeosphaeria sporulosa]OAG11936.1 hypothetical protein CC84DRAFT_1201070 [Paraphaeosphaeria sporulosa]